MTVATIEFRDLARKTATLHLAADGYPDGEAGVLLALGRALDRYAGPALPGFDAGILSGHAAPHLRATRVAGGTTLRAPFYHYLVQTSVGAERAVYVEAFGQIEPCRPGAPGGWTKLARFLVFPREVRHIARSLDPHGLPASAAQAYPAQRAAAERARAAGGRLLGELPHVELLAAAKAMRKVADPMRENDQTVWARTLVERAAMAEARHARGTAPGGPRSRRRA